MKRNDRSSVADFFTSPTAKTLLDHILIITLCYMSLLLIDTDPAFLYLMSSSDGLTIPSLVIDLEHSLANYSGWQLPRAPFIFPDAILFSLFRIIFDDFRLRIMCSEIFQIVACTYIIGWAISFLSERSQSLCRYIFLAILTSVSLAICAINQDAFFNTMMWLYTPYNHFIYFAFAIFGVCVTLRYPHNKAVHGFMFVFVFLCIFSDQIFLVNYNAPFAALLLLLGLLPKHFQLQAQKLKRRDLLLIFVRDTVATALGIFCSQFQNRQDAPAKSFAPKIMLHKLFLIYNTFPLKNWAGFIACVIPWIIALTMVVLFLRKYWRNKIPPGKFFSASMLLYFALATIINVGGAMVIYDIGCQRYMMAAIFSPLIVASAGFVEFFFKNPKARSYLWLALVALPLFFLGMNFDILNTDHFLVRIAGWKFAMSDDLLACAQQYGLKTGLADYWASRPLIMASNWKLHVNQLEPTSSKPFHWGSNVKWFTEDFFNPNQSTVYNFILLTKDNTHNILSDYGPPQKIFSCDGTEVALYDETALTKAVFNKLPGDPVKAAQVKQIYATIKSWPHAKGELAPAILEGAAFSSQIGQLDGAVWRTKDHHPDGYLVFGPGVSLPAGHYVFEIEYSSRQKGAPVIWDIVSNVGKDTHGSMTLAATPTAKWQEGHFVTATLDVKLDSEAYWLETRVWSDSLNDVGVRKIIITRLKDSVSSPWW